jgi:hypothetical protein
MFAALLALVLAGIRLDTVRLGSARKAKACVVVLLQKAFQLFDRRVVFRIHHLFTSFFFRFWS